MAFFGEVAMSATMLPSSDTQLAGLTEDNLEDGHEGRGLTEVAGADDVSVDAQPFRVVPRLNAPGDAVETVDDGRGECLFPKLVVEELQALAGVVQLPLGLGVCSGGEAALDKVLKCRL